MELQTPDSSEFPESHSSTSETSADPPPSYVKLAMRNMVRKSGKSLRHFFLTATGLLAIMIGLAYLTR